MERVLLPTDGSDCAERAAGLASGIARDYDATLHTLHISETVPGKVDGPPILDVDPESTDCEAIQRIYQRAREYGTDGIEAAISSGYPFREIVRYVELRDIDLVVMGSHDRTGLGRVLNRSTTKNVIRRSPVPVLTVPESAEESAMFGLPEQ